MILPATWSYHPWVPRKGTSFESIDEEHNVCNIFSLFLLKFSMNCAEVVVVLNLEYEVTVIPLSEPRLVILASEACVPYARIVVNIQAYTYTTFTSLARSKSSVYICTT